MAYNGISIILKMQVVVLLVERETARPSIRTRVVSITAIAFLFMLVLLYAIFYISMQRLLVQRENDSMLSQVRLAESVLQSSVNYLPRATRDWSSWDNTYDYVLGDYDEFLDDSLTEYPFQLYRLNFIAILDAHSEIVYERFYDFTQAAYMTSMPDLSSLYARIGPMTMASFDESEQLDLVNTTQIGKTGFVNQDGQVYYFSAYPVIHSDETGPCVGTFIFGRIVDPGEMEYLTEHSGMGFSLAPMDESGLTLAQQSHLSKQETLLDTSEDSITAYLCIDDLFGQDSLTVSFSSQRTLYQQGISFIGIILVVIAICCTLVLVIILNLLNRVVIQPIGTLVGELDGVDMDSIDTTLSYKSRNRELSNLTTSINGMLLRIRNARDVIEKNNERLYRHAHFDMLSGLRNRFSTVDHLEAALDMARKEVLPISVFFFDLDRFKQINNTMGHSAGDGFIVALANRMSQEFGDDMIISRMGGDEFVIVVKGLRDPSERQLFANRILSLFTAPFNIKHRKLSIGASIGSSSYPEDGQDAETLIKNAEIAMFRAKELGDGLYVPYERSLQTVMQRRIFIENQLRIAINDGCHEFRAYFQPKVDARSRGITGCEALIRWVTDDGIISPGEFIPQAEESGLILPLSWWMIRECCRLGKMFEREGIDCSISINVSAQVLLHDDFLHTVRRAAEESGIALSKLDIEIVEATLVEDMERVNGVLRELHNLGMEISVDDFGTGYSSLSYLNKLSVDRIKIDRSFISRIGDSAEDEAIINAIIAMSKSLHMIITAEGVETEAQYAFLREAGCDEIQGYIISKPVPSDAFMSFTKQHDKKALEA